MKQRFLLGMIVLSILIVTLSSCSTSAKSDGFDKKYPLEQYISALGYGKTQEAADANALSNFSTIFGAEIQTNTVLGTKENNSNGESNHEDFFSSATSISSRIDNLFGITISERGNNKDGYYSLAVMERSATIHNSKEKLKDYILEINNLEKLAKENIGSISSVSYSVSLLSKVEDYNTITMTINYLTGENNSLLSLSSSRSILRDALNSTLIYLEASGDVNGIVEGAVSDFLTENGFSITDEKEKANCTLKIKLDWVESKGTDIAEGFVFQEYSAKISLLDETSNKTIFSCSQSGKEGHVSFEGAKMRAIDRASNEIKAQLESQMKGRYYL